MPSKSKNKTKKEKKNYKYPKDENTKKLERDPESKKKKKAKKNYMKRNWDDYLKENPGNFEINLKKRKENKIQNDSPELELEKNNKNVNLNKDICKTNQLDDSNKEKEILEKEKNINIENNKYNLNNNSDFGKDESNNSRKENLGNEKSNITKNLINNKNNWTEILYDIVDNFSDESLFANNSEETLKHLEDKEEEKNQIGGTNNNADTIETEKKSKKSLPISHTKSRNYSNNEDLTKPEKLKGNEKQSNLELNQIKFCNDNTIIFDGKEFKCFNRDNIYKRNDDLKRYIYKCINYRKEEKFREANKLKKFCSATIVYIPTGQKKKTGYNLKEGHSIECLELGKENKIKKEKIKKKKRIL